tara:strand:- start:189 stop:1544 length:1356 start_codon:yes stop_codon:yes gene_type:complete
MKILLVLLLLIPSLSWGLTFKDGQQVDSDQNNLKDYDTNIDWKINNPFQVFLPLDQLQSNIDFYKSSNSAFICEHDEDGFSNDYVTFNNNEFRESLKKSFNKTFTDWDTMDEFSAAMLEFSLASCKTMLSGIEKDKKELLSFIIEISKLEKFYSITPEWVMDHSGPFWFARHIPPILMAWSYVRDMATNEQQLQMHKWIDSLYNQLIVDDNCLEWKAGSCFANHAYSVRNALITMAIMLDDEKKFSHNVEAFFKVLKMNIRKDGLLENELRRGHCSTHYHIFALSSIFGVLQNLQAQGYDYYNGELGNSFTIRDIIDVVFNKFLIYPKTYLASVKDPYAIDTCPTKGQKFVYEYEQIDFFQTSLFGFVSLFENNVNNAQGVDFSNIQKLQIIWDEKKSDGNKYNYEDYNEDGKIDSLYYITYDVREAMYNHTWGNAVYGGNPILLNKIKFD